MVGRDESTDRRNVLKKLAAGVTVTGLAGCTGNGDGGDGGGGGAETETDTGTPTSQSTDTDSGGGGELEFNNITALGGITGGSGYQQCLVMQQIVHKNFDNVRVTVSGTDGWSTDAKLMWARGQDAGHFGIVPAGDAHDILHGNEPYNEERNYIVQAWPAVPPTYMHVAVRKNSDIESYEDLSGKRVNILSRGSLTEGLTPQILKAIGVEPAKYLHYPHQEAAGALESGDVDAVAAGGAASAYMEVSQNTPLRVLEVTDEQQSQISDAISWLGFATVDFGQWYNGAGEVTVPAPWTLMATLLDMPDDFVYQITKAMFNNIDLAQQIYEPASQLTPDDAPKTRIPVHPGAYQFYQEEGVEFPEELQPPEQSELPLES